MSCYKKVRYYTKTLNAILSFSHLLVVRQGSTDNIKRKWHMVQCLQRSTEIAQEGKLDANLGFEGLVFIC